MRLLPFVEKRLNIIELAPKGTGKSYLFGHVSKYGLLTDGGKVTRAKMFYDVGKKIPGFINGNDFVAIDEVKLVTFGDVNEMRSIMQGYMEYADNAATTKLDIEAFKLMTSYLLDDYANPSQPYSFSRKVKLAIWYLIL